MIIATIVWGSPGWLVPATVFFLVTLALLLLRLRGEEGRGRAGWIGFGLKVTGLALLVICLLEPLFSETRARPGANLFVVLADDSRSLRIKDRGQNRTRGEILVDRLGEDASWRKRLERDFDVRTYRFGARVRALSDPSELTLESNATALHGAVETLTRRFRNRPLAGILLLTDGNATDTMAARAPEGWPPVHPVVLGAEAPARDLSVQRATVRESNFEAAPVTIQGEIRCYGHEGDEVVVELLDEEGEIQQTRTLTAGEDGRALAVHFQIRPEATGVRFYRLRARAESEVAAAPEDSREATLINNERMVVVDRGGGPFRILYVAGRPGWEFKFLRRAVQEDAEVELVGLIRIAKREPKFNFIGRAGESTNPLFRGFGNVDDEEAERYDQPVLLRIGTRDDEELRDGFPGAAEELFAYHAVVLDDVEASFFTRDQMSLIEQFVSRRGARFLMLGGLESFRGGGYDRTPIGELLPVYLDGAGSVRDEAGVRLSLTREGWVQPWIRLRMTEEEEKTRLAAMPSFKTVNSVAGAKPGAAVVAEVEDDEGRRSPALVVQRFGVGRAAALLVGDLWRWGLRRRLDETRDLEKAWRQTARWLVADVPERVALEVRPHPEDPDRSVRLQVRLRDGKYEPLDSGGVRIRVHTPDGTARDLDAEPSDHEAGLYETTFVPRHPGAHRAEAMASLGNELLDPVEVGWVSQPGAAEFRELRPDRELLSRIAARTGGEMIAPDGLDDFVGNLATREAPVTEPWIHPAWHQGWIFLLAILCLVGEWGLRRFRGLP